MAIKHLGLGLALTAAALTCLARPAAAAADGPANEALKNLGLKPAGSIVVFNLETDVKNKLSEARRLSKQVSQSLMEQQAMINPKEQERNIKTLTDEIRQLRSEIDSVNQQIAQVPRNTSQYGGQLGGQLGAQLAGRFGGEYGGGNGFANNETNFANNTAAEEYAELVAYRNQLQAELKQDSLFLNQLKSQETDPKAKGKIDAEVKKNRDAYHQAIVDLRKLVDATTARYAEAAKSSEVTKAIKLASKELRERLKLGPSREFLGNVKLVEKLEKAEASGETFDYQAPRSRRSRGKTSGKNASKGVAGRTDGPS